MSKFRNFEKYEVYPDGMIWSYSRKKFLKPWTNKDGYQQVMLYDNEGKGMWYRLHRVIYEAVTGKPIPEGYEINHISEIKTENFFENLQLLSHKDNMNYGTCTKRMAKSKSKKVGAFQNGKLVMTFTSTKEAGINGFNQGNVASCCRNCFNRPGNNVYKGFEWKYL